MKLGNNITCVLTKSFFTRHHLITHTNYRKSSKATEVTVIIWNISFIIFRWNKWMINVIFTVTWIIWADFLNDLHFLNRYSSLWNVNNFPCGGIEFWTQLVIIWLQTSVLKISRIIILSCYNEINVVVQFYTWFQFYHPMCSSMMMCDNEFKTKESKISTT